MIPSAQGMDLILTFLEPPVLIYSTSHVRSGYYVLKTDHLFFAYCDMELDCGGAKGGWMRIADFRKGDTCSSGRTRYNSNYCTGGSPGMWEGGRISKRNYIWMAFSNMHVHMEKLIITKQ